MRRLPIVICYLDQTAEPPVTVRSSLDGLVERTGDNVRLLLWCEFDEVYSVAGYTDRQLRIVLRMLLCVQKGISVEYVYVEVMAAFCCIAIQ